MSLNQVLGVPEDHLLVNLSYEEKGPMASDGYWTYEERNREGRVIASIEYWDCATQSSAAANNGYRKHDPNGRLIEEKIF